MQVPSSYCAVIFIWSTTPLAIHWSNDGVGYVNALVSRMLLAALLACVVLKMFRLPFIEQKKDWWIYLVGAFGLFPNMMLFYWAAQTVPSGLMSVLMGTYPFLVGIFSFFVLQINAFTVAKVLALLLAIIGLCVINVAQMKVGEEAFGGVLAIVLACINWAFFSVLIKKMAFNMSPVRLSAGCLVVSAPFFAAFWLLMEAKIPTEIASRSLLGIVYLVVIGSVVGQLLWFFVLRVCAVTSVSLVTLVSPVMALMWGAMSGEVLSIQMLLGIALILMALAIYLDVPWMLIRAYKNRFLILSQQSKTSSDGDVGARS